MIIMLPTHLTMGIRKPKQVPLNLNHYRNADFNQLNNMKILFDELVSPLLSGVPYMEKVALSYRLFMPSKRAVDISNVCCIVDKFFSDTLKNANKIPDDNSSVIPSVKYLWGGVDKENPRVEVTLMEIEPMKMTTLVEMTESEVNDAIQAYITKEFSIREGTEFKIQWNNDSSCSVTIGSSVSSETKESGKRRGRPPKTETEAPAIDFDPRKVIEQAKALETPEKPIEEPLRVVEEPTLEAESEAQEDASEETEGTIYPLPEQPVREVVSDSVEETQEQPVEEAPAAQETVVTPVVPSKGLFPSKMTSSPTPAVETKPEATAPSKSLFNLKGLGAPKNDTK